MPKNAPSTKRAREVLPLLVRHLELSPILLITGHDSLNAINAFEAALGRPPLSEHDFAMATFRNQGKIWEDF